MFYFARCVPTNIDLSRTWTKVTGRGVRSCTLFDRGHCESIALYAQHNYWYKPYVTTSNYVVPKLINLYQNGHGEIDNSWSMMTSVNERKPRERDQGLTSQKPRGQHRNPNIKVHVFLHQVDVEKVFAIFHEQNVRVYITKVYMADMLCDRFLSTQILTT